MHLCFNKKDFHKIIDEHDIKLPDDPRPLQLGVAETHSFNNVFNGSSLVIVVFDLAACDTSASAIAGTVAHEANHVIERVLEHIGEDHDDFGEESRSYLLQYLVEQMFEACIQEVKNAKRKEDRTKTEKKGEGTGGFVLKVGKPGDDGGAGSIGVFAPANILSGTKRPEGRALTKTKISDLPARPIGHKGPHLMFGSDGRRLH